MTDQRASSPASGGHVHEDSSIWQTLTEEERTIVRQTVAAWKPSQSINELLDANASHGERIADRVAAVIGSWKFIIIQSAILFSWIVLNVIGWIKHWDPYPFILLNLALSFQSAYSAPIIMMSQNRQSAKDRFTAESDYHVNLHAEVEVAAIATRLDDLAGNQWNALVDLQHQQLQLLQRIEQLTTEVHRLAKLAGVPASDASPDKDPA